MLRFIMMFILGLIVALLGINLIQNNSSTLPSDALVAFPDDCPEDWQEYKHASGRMLLVDGQGEGLAPRKAGETGGVDEVGQGIEKVQIVNQLGANSGDGVIIPNSEKANKITREINIPKQEMPPYLVVKLCSRSQTH